MIQRERETEEDQLIWYGHVQRMAEERLPKTAFKWMPKQKRARGRPKKNWMEGIRKATNKRNLNEGQRKDKKQWSLGARQRKKSFETDMYIYIYEINFRSRLRSAIKNYALAQVTAIIRPHTVRYN